jgi:hypothetical protein
MGSKIQDAEHAFWRKLILPEEDRRRLMAVDWDGKGYRWFRSPNVIPIEQWRRELESVGDERKVG